MILDLELLTVESKFLLNTGLTSVMRIQLLHTIETKFVYWYSYFRTEN